MKLHFAAQRNRSAARKPVNERHEIRSSVARSLVRRVRHGQLHRVAADP
jgi:hypothetical protein